MRALMPSIRHTASITTLTGAGGLFMLFTSVTSFLDSVLSAASACSSSGIATASSPSHSSLIALAAAAFSAAAASSPCTTCFCAAASLLWLSTTRSVSSTSLPVRRVFAIDGEGRGVRGPGRHDAAKLAEASCNACTRTLRQQHSKWQEELELPERNSGSSHMTRTIGIQHILRVSKGWGLPPSAHTHLSRSAWAAAG